MAFLIGKHPYIDLKVALPNGKWIGTDCLIDTGFSGGLVLPKDLEDEFPEDEFVEARFVLADGSEITINATYTVVEYGGHKKEVGVVFMGDSEALVGVEFLDQMRFCLDLIRGKIELSFTCQETP